MTGRVATGVDLAARMRREAELAAVAPRIPMQRRVSPPLFVSDEEKAMHDDVFDGWVVREVHGRWMARHPEHGDLQDRVDGRYAAQYKSRDELLEHLLGR